jgi:hypothetical protein
VVAAEVKVNAGGIHVLAVQLLVLEVKHVPAPPTGVTVITTVSPELKPEIVLLVTFPIFVVAVGAPPLMV